MFIKFLPFFSFWRGRYLHFVFQIKANGKTQVHLRETCRKESRPLGRIFILPLFEINSSVTWLSFFLFPAKVIN